MKRIVALTMVLSLVATLFITVPASAAATAPEDVELYRNRLSAMGVLSGDLDMDAEVSRGLMAALFPRCFTWITRSSIWDRYSATFRPSINII